MLVTGCDALSSAPTYGALSIAGFNYTPYNLDRFVVTDKFGNRASGGALLPGAGEGRLSCCYKLKGTEFTVTWNVVDQDEFLKDPYGPLPEIHKTAHVHFPPTAVKGDLGERVLGLHFYPDDHVEFEFRTDLGGTRIFYAEVWDWLRKTHGKLINPSKDEDGVVFRRTARLAAGGWIKYHFTDTKDLEQYVYYTLLNPNFDQHPSIQKIIAETRDKPGAFGAAMAELPMSIVEALKQGNSANSQQRATHG
ncbi:MAG: hypothetical protein INH12_31580 [Cupriavidus sp.]|nr:hypothetical protein [Cupriavidus sp.]MCA3199945.1 hypothetical protein [Cupriavidus sp.]MCA3205543.1 hypothetical protein [Cupriavidus sp.]MCA3205955.1 hypothetical protein [Cupriavidus sp.]QWE97753.1 DUF3304 domain-containing protein [Cupriavidus sp. EM10]